MGKKFFFKLRWSWLKKIYNFSFKRKKRRSLMKKYVKKYMRYYFSKRYGMLRHTGIFYVFKRKFYYFRNSAVVRIKKRRDNFFIIAGDTFGRTYLSLSGGMFRQEKDTSRRGKGEIDNLKGCFRVLALYLKPHKLQRV